MILLLAALFLAAPSFSGERVTIGAYINDIQFVDLKTHSYAVDLYLWFRWRDPKRDPSASAEFMNPYELWGHVRTQSYAKPVRLPSGEWYQVVRNQGRFSRKLPLHRYPFDRQTLVVELEDASAGTGEHSFVADPRPLAINPELQLPGYSLGEPSLRILQAGYPTDFGDPSGPPTYSRVRIEIPIHRPVLTYSIKLLLPIVCVVICAALMFLFHPKYVDARVGIGITALLTIVALQITLNADLPEVNYLVLMDKVYLAAYLFVIAGLSLVVHTTWRMDRGEAVEARTTERRNLAILAGLFAAGLALALAL